MSRLISDILNAPEPHFSHALRDWEEKSGRHGHDIRLASEIGQNRRKALSRLQLDEADTTPRELYFALCQRAAISNQALLDELKIDKDDTPGEVIGKITKFIDTLPINRDVWTIKHSVIKQILKKQPPKKLLKILGLKSIDSVLKRTSSYELLTLAYQIENAEWSAKMRGQYKKLKPVDFQGYTSSLFMVDNNRVAKLHKGGYKSSRIVVPNYETGTLLVVPPKDRFRLDVLALTLALLQSLYDLRVHSAYFRLISVKNNFGSKLQAAVQNGLPGSFKELEIGWAVLQRHFSQVPESFLPIEQPHLHHSDVILTHPTRALAKKIPEFNFWDNTAYLFMIDGEKPVSMHIMDVVTNASNQLPYENRAHMHLQNHLWEELGLRYLQHEDIRDESLKRIEDV